MVPSPKLVLAFAGVSNAHEAPLPTMKLLSVGANADIAANVAEMPICISLTPSVTIRPTLLLEISLNSRICAAIPLKTSAPVPTLAAPSTGVAERMASSMLICSFLATSRFQNIIKSLTGSISVNGSVSIDTLTVVLPATPLPLTMTMPSAPITVRSATVPAPV